MLKTIVEKYFSSFYYFYQHLGYRIFLSLLFSLSVGLLDGFGLTMFLPLLQLVAGNTETVDNGEGMGGMEFIIDGFKWFGVPLTIESVLIIIILFFGAKGIAYFARQYYNVIVRLFFITKLRFESIDGLAYLRYKAFVQSDSGRIQNTLSGEVARVSGAYQAYFQTVQSIIMMGVYVGLAFITNPQFAILVIIGGMLSNLAYRQIYKKTKAVSAKITQGGHHFQRQLIQFVAHFKYLKSTALLEQYADKMKDSVVYIESANKKIGLYNSILSATREPLNIAVVAIVILAQIYFFSAALSGIILALLFFYRALNYVISVQNSWNNFLNVSGSLDNVTKFMQELKTEKENYGKIISKQFNGNIKLDNVSFKYGEKPILKSLKLNIPSKSTIAFVGESGSGKTTLANIIAGLMPVEHGQIKIDNISYQDLDLRSLQQRIGYVSQDPVIFSESVFDNITLWANKDGQNLKRFWEACEKASIAEFIRQLPDGMDTLLGNNGIQVSGGQKQRLAIARELYKEIDLLILDEATSALDSAAEVNIQENIESLKGEYTIILIAHRLSTIRNADNIIVLSDGKVEAIGPYEHLLANSNRFSRMVALQEV